MTLRQKTLLKYFKNVSVILVITFILLELTLAIYIHVRELRIELPTYSFENTQGFWFDLNQDYGTSHLPNHSYRQKKSCYDVLYETNAHGFRDKEREVNDIDRRVVVLGDSFVEGVGVAQDNRMSDRLEMITKQAHLNYGMAGNFGPTQYYILYKTMASNFSHDAILIGLLPSNDFIDDDYDINKKVGGNRYRPFFKGAYPNYSTVYHLDSLHKSKAIPRKQNSIRKFLKNFTYSYNIYAYTKARQRLAIIPEDKILSAKEVPSYFNYSVEQFNRMKFALEQIKDIAGDREVMVFSIPILPEIIAYREHGFNPLGEDLKLFCLENNIQYLDLLPFTNDLSMEECEALFLDCDGHWSNLGNKFAEEQIRASFNYYQ